MIVQKLHWNGQPRPASKRAQRFVIAPDDLDRQKRRDLLLQPGQIVHEIVDRLQLSGERVGEHPVEPSLGLAGEQRDPHVARRGDVGRQFRQHRQAARHVKSADRDLHAGRAKLPRDIDRPRKLVRLHADQAHEPAIGRLDAPDDALDRDHRVALVIGVDLDRDIGTERRRAAASCAIA